MNRFIKFRALRSDRKGWVYGYVVSGGLFGGSSSEVWIFCQKEKCWFQVTPESVGQLLHTEKNGRQWWEGDKAEIRAIKYVGPDEYGDNSDIDKKYSGTVCMHVTQGLSIKIDNVFDNNAGEEVKFWPNAHKTIVFSRSVITGNIHEPTHRKGDKVIMSGCAEASMEEYKRKVWQCRTDSFKAKCGDEVVFLEGFSGYFMAKYLVKVEEVSNG